ncbi:hypothetical protein NQ315_015647 [Exocentrus adspersus]|uniref:Uncharacterized protein n=1 Tax=Exocentrus adspersus TaxID=1586481 RepID=A0AAV8W472_9CUCU|nr:hypothetical protein NQ315_015647 [Exocentrus adspersus]
MKRSFETISDVADTEDIRTNKVVLVERDAEPGGIALVNPLRASKKTHVELMELEENVHNGETYIHANAKNKLDIIGKQMKSLQVLMNDVINETRLHSELNNAACNFVRKPGNEWVNVPHNFLGSFRLEVDMSWTPAGQEETRYEGINFLKDIMSSSSGVKALLTSNQ